MAEKTQKSSEEGNQKKQDSQGKLRKTSQNPKNHWERTSFNISTITLAAASIFSTISATLITTPVQAGVFNLPHFLEPKKFAIGLEPEVILTTGAGVGVNARYTHGLSEMNNLSVILGTGSGPRQFRAGGAFTFDFFPDVDDQPGIGLAIEALFVQLPHAGSVEITGIPYIHKNLSVGGAELDPFLAVPAGITLSSGTYQPLVTIAIGTQIQHSEHFSSVVEFGAGILNANTYFSGGLVYRN